MAGVPRKQALLTGSYGLLNSDSASSALQQSFKGLGSIHSGRPL